MEREGLVFRNWLKGLLRACAVSRLGWFLAIIHALCFYLGVRSMGPPSRAAAAFLDTFQGADWTFFAGRPFHYAYQSWVLKSVVWADMPAMLVEYVLGLLLLPFRAFVHVGTYEGSYISAAVLFVLATGQWLIIGCLLQKRFWPKLS
ncbi:MAG TPA: hypothetical protein VKF84_16560 [Candidatus Sulfotelmatobacter sp.]|nr:hypothetical protein [Candidatus Sulfotelmatobacter sp.]